MNTKQRFIDVVKNGTDRPYVSLQIGAGAGFDCKLAGKEWISEGTVEDTVRAYEMVGCDPLINIALPDIGRIVPSLKWQTRTQNLPERRVTDKSLQTPFGDIYWQLLEQPRHGITPKVYPLTSESEHFFDIVSWYAEQTAKAKDRIGELINPVVEKYGTSGPIDIQWNIQPFELLGLASVQDLAIKAMTEPQEYTKVCDLIAEVNISLIEEVFKAGADFVFLGGPGAEMLSPKLYEDFLVPDSRKITSAVHNAGGLVYTHICSPIEPFLSSGFYNRMGIDLFETLSPPPVGNVENLKNARKICSPDMCTRGNIGLDVLLNGTEKEIEQAVVNVIESTKGTKHIIAASDYLFYDIPVENVKKLIKTASRIN